MKAHAHLPVQPKTVTPFDWVSFEPKRIAYCSDLHLEFHPWAPKFDADLLLLAGDVHLQSAGVIWAQKLGIPVIYTPGNHEYYGSALGRMPQKAQEVIIDGKVVLADMKTVEMKNLRVIAATLWTDYRVTGNEPLAMWDAKTLMSDFKKIRDTDFRKLRPERLALLHSRARRFIESELDKPWEGLTVVMTHHAPCPLSLRPHIEKEGVENTHLDAAYASDLSHLMGGARAQMWLHGHTHDSLDYEVAGTRVLCNPRGYLPNDGNDDFNPNAIITVSELLALRAQALAPETLSSGSFMSQKKTAPGI